MLWLLDRRGQHIDDLRPEEFEVFEDGRPQQISNFTYVSVQPESKAQNTETTAADKTHPRPPEQLRPEQVRRSIALIVDDLGLSFESTHCAKRAS